MKKRRILTLIFAAVILLIIPVTVSCVAFALPPQFAASYYGELGAMYDKLVSAKGKKIVLIGTSNIAFGIDSALMEEELSESGFSYEVCNFGLYGALGTKLMFDLSRRHIGEGDIVIFSPEPAAQIYSLYFSPMDTWRALDSNLKMFKDIASENTPSLVGNLAGYAAEKYSFRAEGGAASGGVYSKSSFNDNCDMTADRPYNILSGGYDANNPVRLGEELFGEGYFDYINEYYAEISQRGAEMYYSFCPINASSFADGYDKNSVDEFCAEIIDRIDFGFLGNPHDYVMESGWFYDSNFHLNSAGMTVRTVTLINDIKAALNCYDLTDIPLPDMPEVPAGEVTDGQNSYAEYFEYSETNGELVITALKEEGKSLKEITLPVSYRGKPITGFTAEVFKNNRTIEKIVIQTNINRLYDKCFEGCASLKSVVLKQTDPEKIIPGFNLLEGTNGCKIYINKESRPHFLTNYMWQRYKDSLVGE